MLYLAAGVPCVVRVLFSFSVGFVELCDLLSFAKVLYPLWIAEEEKKQKGGKPAVVHSNKESSHWN